MTAIQTTSVENTEYVDRPEGRVGYDVAGEGPLVVLVPGMGDLRAAYRFLAPALREVGYRVACTDLRGHGDSDVTFSSYGDVETAGDVLALIEQLDCLGSHRRQLDGRRCGGARRSRATEPRARPRAARPIRPQRQHDRSAAPDAAGRDGQTMGGALMEGIHAQAVCRPAAGGLRRLPRPGGGEHAPTRLRKGVLAHHTNQPRPSRSPTRRR